MPAAEAAAVLPTLMMPPLALAGCSALESDKVDYRSGAVKAPSLVVPPDLTQLSKDTRYTVINGGVSATGVKTGQTTAETKASVGATQLGDVRIERSGNQRWLVVKRNTVSHEILEVMPARERPLGATQPAPCTGPLSSPQGAGA